MVLVLSVDKAGEKIEKIIIISYLCPFKKSKMMQMFFY